MLLYEEEKNPELWKKYVNKDKSANMAVHGATQPPDDVKEKEDGQEESDSQQPRHRGSNSSSSTQVASDQEINKASGKPLDKEKGKDVFVVDWWGPDDPEV